MAGFKSRYDSWLDLDRTEREIRTVIMMPYVKNCPLSKINNDLRKLMWRGLKHRLLNRVKKTGTTETWDAIKDSHMLYKQLIKKCRREAWRRLCSETSTILDTAKLTKFLTGIKR